MALRVQKKVRRRGKAARSASPSTVSLDGFASLCGVTTRTMRRHLQDVPSDAAWLKVGRTGQQYEIEIEAGVAWFRAKQAASARPAESSEQMVAVRAHLLGEGAEGADLTIPGKRRFEEYRAAEAALSYRQSLGELLPAADMEAAIGDAVVRLRQSLIGVGADVRRQFGLSREVEGWIYDRLADRMKAFVADLDTATRPVAP